MQVPPPESIWYLPHHPVTNSNKPGKLRRAANAASKFRVESLNSNLLTGPDLLENLVGILLRFRKNPVAVFSDIKGMFMQIDVRQKNQSALRFLRMIKNNIRLFQFTRLIFAATNSPFCAIYVLHRRAEHNKILFPAALNSIKRQFYIDDYIQSMPTIAAAQNSISQTKDCLKKGSFRLKKFNSNFKIPDDDKDKTKGIMRVLGQKWNVTTELTILSFFTYNNFLKISSVHAKEIVQFGILNLPLACCLL